MPVSRRGERPGVLLASAQKRRRCDCPAAPRAVEHRRILRPRSRSSGKDDHPARRIPGGDRRIRRRFLRHLPAGGGVHGSPAPPGSGGGLGGPRTGRHCARRSEGFPDRGLRRHRAERLRTVETRQRGSRTDRHLRRHRQPLLLRRWKTVLYPGIAGAEHGDRYGLLLLAGSHPSGLFESEGRGLRDGAGRRGSPGRFAGGHDLSVPGARPRPGRTMQDLRCGGGRLRPWRGLRDDRPQAALGRPKGPGPDSGPDPGIGG